MQTEFAGDRVGPDEQILETVAERPGKPIRLRIQPMVLRTVAGKGGQYHAWRDVRWTLECDSAEEVFATREAMYAFFNALSRGGVKAVQAALESVGKEDAA